jgi:hypothetical protein
MKTGGSPPRTAVRSAVHHGVVATEPQTSSAGGPPNGSLLRRPRCAQPVDGVRDPGRDGDHRGTRHSATTPEGLTHLCRNHQLPPGTMVGLETGTSAFYAARAVAALQLVPVVVDAHEVRRTAHRPAPKSDRRDAFEVCDGIRRGLYRSVVYIPSPAISTLRTALSRRRHFVRIQTAEVNATKRLLRGAGWLVGTRTSLRSATSWDRLLAAFAAAPELAAMSACTMPCGNRRGSRSAPSTTY